MLEHEKQMSLVRVIMVRVAVCALEIRGHKGPKSESSFQSQDRAHAIECPDVDSIGQCGQQHARSRLR
jgi:hypothetical protein